MRWTGSTKHGSVEIHSALCSDGHPGLVCVEMFGLRAHTFSGHTHTHTRTHAHARAGDPAVGGEVVDVNEKGFN